MSEQPRKKRKHEPYTAAEKAWLLEYHREHPNAPARELGERLANHVNSFRSASEGKKPPPGTSTINDWKKAETRIMQMASNKASACRARDRSSRHPKLEEALSWWLNSQEQRGLHVNADQLIHQAKQFGLKCDVPDSFAYSAGWLARFRSRHKVCSTAVHGSPGSARAADQVRDRLRNLLDEEGYSADNTYSQCDVVLLWRCMPFCSRAKHSAPAADATETQRVTLTITCNASGTDKRPLLLVGKAKRPRSWPPQFCPARDLHPKGVHYTNNKTAWMTSQEFSKRILNWNESLRGNDRRIALITASTPTNIIPDHAITQEHSLTVCNLSHIKLIFLPTTIISALQPLNQGIIRAMKAHYRCRLVKGLLSAAAAPANTGRKLQQLRPTAYQMLLSIHAAWTTDVSATLIARCWRKCSILPHGWLSRLVSQPSASAAAAAGVLCTIGMPAEPARSSATGETEALSATEISTAEAEGDRDHEQAEAATSAERPALPPDKPDSGALAALEEALQAFRRGLSADTGEAGDEVLDAAGFVDVEEGKGVVRGLGADDMLRSVLTRGTDEPDSDEDEREDFVEPAMAVSEAISCAQALREYVMACPQYMRPGYVSMLDDVIAELQSAALSNRQL